MKKVLLRGVLLGSVCLCALGIKKNLMFNTSRISSLMLENVEALSYDLPEVVITCDTKGWGRCYTQLGLVMNGEFEYYPCHFTGYEKDYCPEPKYHG